jgi:hypothetical protein
MRRMLIAMLGVALLTGTVLAVRGAAADRPAPPAQAATAAAGHQHAAAATSGGGGKGLANQLVKARLATARYATSLRAAKADGYQIITRMIPDMGWHFLNPAIQGFDVTRLRQAQPRVRRRLQLLAPGPGDPARVAVVPQPRRPLQRHQPPDPTLQPGIADPSAIRPGPGPARARVPASSPRKAAAATATGAPSRAA